jgi:hypothetical protein
LLLLSPKRAFPVRVLCALFLKHNVISHIEL